MCFWNMPMTWSWVSLMRLNDLNAMCVWLTWFIHLCFYFAASRKEITPIIDIIYLDHNLCHIWFNISVSIKYVFYCQSRLTISNWVIVYVTLTKHASRRLVSCMKNTYKQNTFCECIWISIDGVFSFAKSSTKVWYYRNCHLVDTS